MYGIIKVLFYPKLWGVEKLIRYSSTSCRDKAYIKSHQFYKTMGYCCLDKKHCGHREAEYFETRFLFQITLRKNNFTF